jgi:hypothetical protein
VPASDRTVEVAPGAIAVEVARGVDVDPVRWTGLPARREAGRLDRSALDAEASVGAAGTWTFVTEARGSGQVAQRVDRCLRSSPTPRPRSEERRMALLH